MAKDGFEKIPAIALEVADLDRLIKLLIQRGYTVIAPRLKNGAIVYANIAGLEDLPIGYRDRQQPGIYRLENENNGLYFGYTTPANSPKYFLHPPQAVLWEAHSNGKGFKIEPPAKPAEKYAFIGVRPCDLAAIRLYDRIFDGSDHSDPIYNQRRKDCLIVAVNCTQPGEHCFCASMGSGPVAEDGFDIVLTEIVQEDKHFFIADLGSQKGSELVGELDCTKADADKLKTAAELLEAAAHNMGKVFDAKAARELFPKGFENPHWEEVIKRCLVCGNCTMVCPTCFCSTVVDRTSLDLKSAQRIRCWDSCFNIDFTYIHGGYTRSSRASRYRQWCTHKLSTMHQQFGQNGCVGCGRCITWCPVGIDITKEAEAVLENIK